jgi:hypothetical protein
MIVTLRRGAYPEFRLAVKVYYTSLAQCGVKNDAVHHLLDVQVPKLVLR